jgi:CBS domain-containing protein
LIWLKAGFGRFQSDAYLADVGRRECAMRQMSEFVKNQRPLTLSPEASVKHACQKMRQRRVGAVLVTDRKSRLVGIFTGRDAVCRVLAEGKDPSETRLAEVMTPDPAAMPPESTAIAALHLMRDGGFRHVPIVADGRVAGVISYGDFRGSETARLDEETGFWERL